MLADSLVDIVNWIIQTFIYPLFSNNLPLLPFNSYQNILTGLQSNFQFAFSIINKFFPIDILIIFIVIILTSEGVLLAIKGGMFLVNLVRGSGA